MKRYRISILVLALAIGIAFWVWHVGLDGMLVQQLLPMGIAGAFFLGFFMNAEATAPLAILLALDLMQIFNPLQFAVAAAVGAALVNVGLFYSARGMIEANATQMRASLRARFGPDFTKLLPGGFVLLGLPLPDEWAMAMMGMGKVDAVKLAALALAAKLAMLLVLYRLLPV